MCLDPGSGEPPHPELRSVRPVSLQSANADSCPELCPPAGAVFWWVRTRRSRSRRSRSRRSRPCQSPAADSCPELCPPAESVFRRVRTRRSRSRRSRSCQCRSCQSRSPCCENCLNCASHNFRKTSPPCMLLASAPCMAARKAARFASLVRSSRSNARKAACTSSLAFEWRPPSTLVKTKSSKSGGRWILRFGIQHSSNTLFGIFLLSLRVSVRARRVFRGKINLKIADSSCAD